MITEKNGTLIFLLRSYRKGVSPFSVVTMTVTVRPRGEKQLLVRANAQFGITSVEDPATYQDFFNALGKAIFLTAQQVD